MGKRKSYTVKTLYDGTLGGAGYAKNLIFENGTVRKRSGWNVIGEFKGINYEPLSINGIYEFKGQGKTSLVVHAGARIFECSHNLTEKTEIKREDGIVLNNSPSQGVMYNNLLWLGGQSEPLVYDGEMLRRAEGADFAYIPTTTEKIGHSSSDKPGEKKESPNLLTRKRRNSLRGTKTDTGLHFFNLDTRVNTEGPFTIHTSFRVRMKDEEMDDFTTKYVGIDKEGQYINTVVYVTLHTDRLGTDKIHSEATCYDINGNEITVDGVLFDWEVRDGRQLVLYFDARNPYEEDNIIVEFEKADDGLQKSLGMVSVCTLIHEESGESRLAVSCNDNGVYYTQNVGGRVYFPEDNIVYVGQSTEKITSIFTMTNGYVGVFKKNEFYRMKISQRDEEKYSVYFSSDDVGAVNPFVWGVVGTDCIVFNKRGVFGTDDADNPDALTTALYPRSPGFEEVEKSLLDSDVQRAVAVVHKGKYYLFIEGRVYISGDKIKKSSHDYSYSWSVLEGCPCSYAYSLGETLYMGSPYGEIVVFDGGETDRRTHTLKTEKGDFLMRDMGSHTEFVPNDKITAKSGHTLRLDTHFAFSGHCKYHVTDHHIVVPKEYFFDKNGCAALFEGDLVKVKDYNGSFSYYGKILKTDPSSCKIFVGNLGFIVLTSLQLYVERSFEVPYTLDEGEEGFKLLYNGQILKLLNAVSEVRLTEEAWVECELCLPPLDLETGKIKHLYGIGLELSHNSHCTLEIGYETRRSSCSREIRIGSPIDFNRLDFNNLSFNPELPQLIRINCLERHFDYIRLRLYVRGGRFEIKKIWLTYTEGEKNEY